jgi:hypothetical protein
MRWHSFLYTTNESYAPQPAENNKHASLIKIHIRHHQKPVSKPKIGNKLEDEQPRKKINPWPTTALIKNAN